MTKNTFNLYKLLGYKRKNSILKSVTITSNYIEAGRFRVVEVEPYDQTGQNCLDTTPTRYDQAINTIEKALSRLEKQLFKANKGFHRKNIYMICVYSNTNGTFEFIFDPITLKEW